MNVQGADGLLRLTTGFALLYAAAALAGSIVDPRLIGPENVWRKPLKFGVSTALYAVTLLWVVTSLSATWRHSRTVFFIALTVCVCTLFELSAKDAASPIRHLFQATLHYPPHPSCAV